MARKFLTALDLTKNELQNAVVQNLASAPSSPVKGQLYFNSTGGDNTLYWWDGTTWQAAKATGGAFPGYGTVPAETTFGIARADGAASTVARSDHTHGSPAHNAAEHSAIPLSALAAATAAINMGGFVINNVGPPVAGTDATNKNYVDGAIAGLAWKDAVRVSTQAAGNKTLSGLTAFDGVTPIANDRILVSAQTTPAENGIYLAASGAWTRALDADSEADLLGAAVYVMEGTANGDTAWVMTTNAPITVGSTAMTWTQFAGAGVPVAGNGLTQTGNTINVVNADASMVIAADSITRGALTGDVTAAQGNNATTIANDVVSNAKLANMNANTFKGNNTGSAADPLDLTVAQMQTALSVQTAAQADALYTKMVAADCAAATNTSVTHNFNTRDVTVTVYRTTTPWDTVDADVERTTVNAIDVRFAVAPTAAQYRIVVVGIDG